MSKQTKRKFRKIRTEFKKELLVKAKENKALAMLIIETYSAWHHRRHITRIWSMFRNPKYSAFKEAYNEQLFGKHLTGRDDIWKSIYFCERELHDKYRRLIPEVYAMGDALGVAYRTLKN